MSAPPHQDTSSDYEPPQDWESAVVFEFTDSATHFAEPLEAPDESYGAHVAFFDGRRTRSLTGRDVFFAENGAVRTPWYRVHFTGEGEQTTGIRIMIGDATGQRTAVEYPLTVVRGEFYFIRAGVYTPAPGETIFLQGFRGYAVPERARSLPTDSLWVGYYTKGRECFNCLAAAVGAGLMPVELTR